ncbi:unnamed protein product [Malus baccata var. baccata]
MSLIKGVYPNLHPPVMVHFERGLDHKFRQPHKTGINFSMFKDTGLLKILCPSAHDRLKGSSREKSEFQVRVVKQILWISSIGNSVEGDLHKEYVICLIEPRDTIVLPCRHMLLVEKDELNLE